MKKLIALTLISTVLLSGCNTWMGFGQDVEQTGEAIQNSAQR